MVQTTNRFFDEVARLMNDTAGVAQGVRREFETLFRGQAEPRHRSGEAPRHTWALATSTVSPFTNSHNAPTQHRKRSA